jgi:hypothetical protein
MRLATFSILYLVVGTAAVVVRHYRGPSPSHRAVVDDLLLWVFWPIYLPFVWSGAAPADPSAHALARRFLATLEGARHSPLANVLPDRQAATALSRSLERALRQRDEIAQLLERPEFSAEVAEARQRRLRADGQMLAATTAEPVTQYSPPRTSARRNAELETVQELLAQLQVQAEVVRLLGESEQGPSALVCELVCRVEGLDAVLDDGLGLDYDINGKRDERAHPTTDATHPHRG